jgi:hypothetical protein
MQELLENALQKKKQHKSAEYIVKQLLQQPEQTYLHLLPRELATYLTQLASIDPHATAEAIKNEQVVMGHAILHGAFSAIPMLLNKGISPEIVRAGANEVPGLWMAAMLSDSEEALEMVKLLLSHIQQLNPTYRGRRLLNVLREMGNRQEISALIESAIRERGQIVPSAPQVQRRGLFDWLSSGKS